jgi:hypothetical protein
MATDTARNDRWSSLATVGYILIKQRSDFDSRSYGYAKLSELLTATILFELGHRRSGGGEGSVPEGRSAGWRCWSTTQAPRCWKPDRGTTCGSRRSSGP